MGLIHLYSATSTSFDDNGTPLVTAREAVVKRDEGFQLTFNIPISQNDLHKRVQKEMIVSAMTPDGVNYFRIWDIEKRTTDVKVTALQLLYSLDVKQVNSFWGRSYTGNSVLQDFANSFKSSISPYTFSSSILTTRAFYTNEKDDDSTSHNALAILNKITDTWSGELMLNGFDVRMVSKLGTKTDALLYEHKNIASFSDSSSMNGIVTRIYATATYTPERAEGATEDPEPVVLTATVDSPLINQYAVIYEATMEYNDARTVDELRTEILKQYSEFNVDKPERTIDVDTNIVDGTAINFGDELVLKYLVHDVDEVIRCVGYEYDPISENYIGVTLGTLEKTFLTKVTEGLTSHVTRQIDKINKQIQMVQTSANGKNRVTYGPNPVPNPIEGDLWFYHPEGRPDEIELLIYQNGLWLPAPFLTDQDKTEFEQELEDYQNAVLAEVAQKDQEYKEIFEGYDEKVLTIDQEIADAAAKAQNALEEAGVSNDLAQTAKDLATTAKTNASTAITNANQAKADASTAATNANQAKADAQTAIADASTALANANLAKTDASKAVTDASKAVTDASTAKTNAQTAINNASTAITNANQAKTDSQTAITNANQAKEDASQALTNAGTAMTNANQAKEDASKAVTDAQTAITQSGQAVSSANTAKTNAQTALSNAQTALSTAQNADTKSGLAETAANTAKTNAQTAISNAQTALDNAQTALTTAGSADTKASQAITKANAIPTTITDIIADKNLVNGTYVDTKVDAATGAWSQELVRVEGKLDGLDIGGRNLLLDSGKVRSTTRTIIVSTYESLSDYVGEDVVVSFDLMINENGILRNIYSSYPYQNNGISIGAGIQARPTEKGVWQRFSIKTQVKDWGDNNPSWTKGSIAFHDNAGVNDYAVRNIKIETGNMATDWTPAPEDLYSQAEFKIFNAQYAQDVTGITGRLTTVESNKLDGSTFQTFKQSEYQVTADKVASTITRVDTAEGKIATHDTSISQNATAIASKASSASVDTLTGRVDTAESNISQNATAITQRVTTTTYNTGMGSKENSVLKQTTAPAHLNGRLWLDTSVTPNILKRSTGSAWIKATPTTASEVGAYSSSQGDTLAGRVTTAETNITQTSEAITSKADKSVVDTLSGTVSNHGTLISQNATAISSKADSGLVNTIKGTVDTHTTEISQNATAIASKASASSVNTLTGRVDTAESNISQNATDIATKASTSSVNTLTGRVDTAESNISQNATAITQRVTTTTYNSGIASKENTVLKQTTAPSHLNGRLWLDTSVTPNVLKRSTGTAWVKATPTTASEVGAYSSSQGDTLAGRVTTAETNITQTATAITSKADKSVVDALAGTVSTQGTTITQQADLIESKANQSEVDTVKGTVSGHTTTLSQHATQIASKAEKSLVDTIKGTVDNHTTDISQNATDIATKASASSVNTLTGRVDTAESNISQNATAISQRVTTTTYNAGIASKENTVLKQTTAPTHSNGRLWLDTSVTPNILKRSTGSTWINATPTTASEVGAYSQSDGAGLAGRLTTAETNITQTATAITSKADKSVVDTLSGTVSTHTTTLSQQATAISSKADKSVVDTIKGTVDNHTTDIAQNATDIATKASASSVNTLTGRVDTAESNITQNATAISQRVTTTTYNSGIASKENSVLKQTTAPAHSNGRLWLDTSVTPNVLKRSTGTAWVKATPTTPGEVGAYSQSDGAGLAGRLTTAETTITQTATAITSKADKSVVDTLAGTVDTHTTEIAQNATAIASKASSASVNTLTGRVDTAETNIGQNATAIASKASTASVNTLTGRVDTAESNISQNATAITQRVTTTTYNAGIASKEDTVLKQSAAPAHLNGRLWLDTSVTPNVLKRSTGSAWVKATPTTASEVGAYSSSQGSTLAGRVTTAETNITQTSEAITSKADKSVVDTLSGTVNTHTTEIAQNATAIASKASTSSVNTLTGRVSTAETTIGQHATSIASKASQTEVDTVKGTVSGHTTTLSQHATQISARLTSAQVNTLVDGKGFSTVNYVDNQITASANGIRADMTRVEGKIDGLEVSGRNLILNSQLVVTTPNNTGLGTATLMADESTPYYRITGNTTISTYGFDGSATSSRFSEPMIDGATYTVSVDVRAPRTGTVSFYSTRGSQSLLRINEWVRIKHTYTYTGTSYRIIGLGYDSSVIDYRNWKIEKGNIATAWSPAPEDTMMESDFNIFKASYEATAESLTSRITAVDKVGGRLSTAETNISQNATAIATKANTSTVNTLTGRVSTAETNISQNATAISSKANTSTVNTLTGRVDTAETNISQNATAIATKASTSSVNTLTGRVSTAESNISQNATAITARLTSAQVNTLVDGKGFATQSWATTQINASAAGITTNISRVEGLIPTGSGSANLITSSDSLSGFVNGTSGSTVTFAETDMTTEWGFKNSIEVTTTGGTSIIKAVWASMSLPNKMLEPMTIGTKYIASMWVKNTGTTTMSVATNGLIPDSAVTVAPGASIRYQAVGVRRADYDWFQIHFRAAAANQNIKFRVGRLMVSRGDLISDWSPAVQDTMDWTNTQIDAKAGSVTTSLTSLINGKVSQSQVDASILADKKIKDTRSTNQTPAWYYTNYPQQKVLEFKTATVVGITESGTTYVVLETDVPWTGNSGGYVTQTATSSTTKWVRRGNSTTWSAWVEEADVTYVNTKVTQTATGIETLITQIKTNPTGTITGYNSLKNNVDSMVQAIGSDGGKISQIVLTNSTYQTTVANQDIMARVGTGQQLYADPLFEKTSNGVGPYNNGTQGLVTTTRELAGAGDPTPTNYRIKVVTTGGGTSPGWGGLVRSTTGRVKAEYVIKFIALLPVGRYFSYNQNTLGTGWEHKWLTDNTGTGDWKEYAYYYKCGTGTVSSFGYLYVQGGATPTTAAPLTWYLAKHETFDISGTNQTQITQLADSWALTLTSGNDIKTQINASTDSIRLASKFIHLSGTSLIDNAVIKSAMVDTLNVSKLTGTTAEFTTLRGKVITAGSITADRLVTGTALVDRVFVDTAAITQLTSKSAFITNIKAISIDVGKITGNTASFFQTAWQGLNSSVIVDSSKLRLTNSAKDFIEMNGIPELRSQDSAGTAAIMGKGRSHYYSGSQARFYIGSNLEGLAQYGVHIAKGQTWGIYRNSDTYGGTPAQYHVVLSGESWRSITTKYWNSSTSVNVLMQLNGYDVNNYPILQPGDTVLIKAAVAGNSSGVETLWSMGTSSSGATRLYSHPEHVFAYRIEVTDRARFIAKALFENSYTNNSDRRIKHDIKDTEVRALDHLDSLTFKEYKLNSTGNKVPLGLIAQDSGILRVKGEDESDYEGIDGLLMPMLAMKGVQELHAIVKAQAEKIKQLEEIINQ